MSEKLSSQSQLFKPSSTSCCANVLFPWRLCAWSLVPQIMWWQNAAVFFRLPHRFQCMTIFPRISLWVEISSITSLIPVQVHCARRKCSLRKQYRFGQRLGNGNSVEALSWRLVFAQTLTQYYHISISTSVQRGHCICDLLQLEDSFSWCAGLFVGEVLWWASGHVTHPVVGRWVVGLCLKLSWQSGLTS